MIKSLENTHGGKHNNPDLIVVHAMAEYLDVAGVEMHATEFLEHIGLSAHALIGPDGTVFRCRPDHYGAWHAKGHNYNSLGVEFLVPGKHDYAGFLQTIKEPYVGPEQYDAGLAQITQWVDAFGITKIERHSDLDPARKQDPGAGFPWRSLLSDVERHRTNPNQGDPNQGDPNEPDEP